MRAASEIKHSSIIRRIIDESPDGIAAEIKLPHFKGQLIASWGMGWDHVSVTPYKDYITPDWEDMCIIKDELFYPSETVVQYHPAESRYVNIKGNCLHLWRPQKQDMPVPPIFMV